MSSRSAADSKHWVRQQRKPCHQSSDSFSVRPSHSYSTNAATTVKECQKRASTGLQCNQERARRTSCAQAGTACTVFSLIGNRCNCRKGRRALGLERYVLLHVPGYRYLTLKALRNGSHSFTCNYTNAVHQMAPHQTEVADI